MKTIHLIFFSFIFLSIQLLEAQTENTINLQSNRYILTPKPLAKPRINGPSIFGVRPGSPFLYTIPATGNRPMKFSAIDLPKGLKIDSKTGQITGSIKTKVVCNITLIAENYLGKATKKFRIVCGDQIGLTPAMGWNTFNHYDVTINQEIILKNANALVKTGLINHGWTYINMDDGWQGARGGKFNAIQGNEGFPNMKKLCNQIHALGLKVGIYSTPWETSYGVFPGGSSSNVEGKWTKTTLEKKGHLRGDTPPWSIAQYHFAINDAKQWDAWGIDYLKYDWFPNRAPETKEMADALIASGRDIIYSLSNNTNIKNAATVTPLANSWRTTGDIKSNWKSMSERGFGQEKWAEFCSPGHFNDPDMLEIGTKEPNQPGLTPDEEYTHMSLWCLLSAPLILGCDFEEIDEFTLSLLTNDEVLALNQDALCKQATCYISDENLRVYLKQLEDGTFAAGFFNIGATSHKIAFKDFEKLNLKGLMTVRDLWRQKDIAQIDAAKDSLSMEIPSHGVLLYKFTTK